MLTFEGAKTIAATVAVLLTLVLALALSAVSASAGVLDAVRGRGKLVCGVSDGAYGYSSRDAKGGWHGLGVDYCRALAVAVLGKTDAVQFEVLQRDQWLMAVQSGAVDVLATDASMTSTADTALGVRFPVAISYDGQGFLVRRSHGVTSALELSGNRVCVAALNGEEQGVLDYFASLKIPIELVKLEGWAEAAQAYEQKSCQVLSGSVSRLAAARARLQAPVDHLMLPELAARHAVGPVIKQGDEQWFSIVRWAAYALFAGESLGVNSANADQLKSSPSPEVRRFLAGGVDLCRHLGLQDGWPQKIVRLVGNYAELYERSLGAKSPLRLDRQLNNLVGKGGLHFAPSFR